MNCFRQCRTCYNHLGGLYAVDFFEHLINENYISYAGEEDFINHRARLKLYVSNSGGDYFQQFGPIPSMANFAFACLDGTEKKPHLAGPAGDLVLSYLLKNQLVTRIAGSRALKPTSEAAKTLQGSGSLMAK